MKGARAGAASTAAEGRAYQPVECPSGGPKKQCEALNVWGKAWQDWGNEVVAELRRLGGGGPAPVSPPPKPPFNP